MSGMNILKSLSFGNPRRSSRKAATSLTLATERRASSNRSCIFGLLSLHPNRHCLHDENLGEEILMIDLMVSEDPPVGFVVDGDGINLWRTLFAGVDQLANILPPGEQVGMPAKLSSDVAKNVFRQIVAENKIAAVGERVEHIAILPFSIRV